MRVLLAMFMLLFAMPLSLADDAVLAEGRALSEAFLDGELEGIWTDMTPELQGVFGDIDGFRGFREAIATSLGAEVEIVSEEVQAGADADVYLRTAKWTLLDVPVLMQWALTDSAQIAGFVVQQVPVLADSRYLDYDTKTLLRLPFSGEWLVVWGGRTLEQNYHAADRAQRFAVDVLISRDGATHRGDAGVLANYFCWDQPILSPGAGEVVSVVDGLPDNAIGTTDVENPAGNHVIIAFRGREYGFLGHLRDGSVKVAAGDTVTAGQELGRCGNSGNTSEPHLHFHLQDTPELTDGEGLPAQFEDYLADGKAVERGEPLAGQLIRPR